MRLGQRQHGAQQGIVGVRAVCGQLVQQRGGGAPGVPWSAQVIFADIDGDSGQKGLFAAFPTEICPPGADEGLLHSVLGQRAILEIERAQA